MRVLAVLVVMGTALLAGVLAGPEPSGTVRRQHSIMKPYLMGGSMVMPYWDFIGNAVVSDDFIRLTPDRQSKRGAIWNTRPIGVKEWEITLHFKIHGQGKALYGDGFALWYTQQRNTLGNVFGSRDRWTGLGIFVDTYSNLELQRSGGGAYVSAIVNDGKIEYDHDQDGTHQEIASCQLNLRNLEQETYMRVIYRKNTLKVLFNTNGNDDWRTCFFVADVFLPRGYFLGVSAATGDLADNHDVISLALSDPPAFTREEREQMQQMQEQDRKTVKDIPDADADVTKPFAASKQAPREHVGPKRKKVSFSKTAFKKIRHQAGDVDQGDSAMGGWWMYAVLAIMVVGGVAGIYYKTQVVDKRNAQRFAF
ncbi:hypothetical protein PTSG_01756 [Salpingoeca rosetta]|uniref:L-type lectin-like domain-containing protein n=1 Tax=Salpingoeca rosetta (strain ATCC 50818 / BSB-021) TaxID=946362 RepID=F2TYV6_SALR5|nr:uncharacterized protein PTSG_01756 [Salpingoeca rosetta]EGD78780.1 hypothetical protein PTSG_01756 [Salpingoeca rosetta]|eukprot:XP_004997736.1 hypothetical protein PTSG_01756 [Salpingoeca rosetta]